MKKSTNVLVSILMSTLVWSIIPMQDMEHIPYGTDQMIHAKDYDNPLSLLPEDMFNHIFFYCHEQDNNPVTAVKESLKNFMTLRCVCKNFNALLLDKTIGNLCNHYTQDSKDVTLKNIVKTINSFNFKKIRTPGLLLVYAGANPNVHSSMSSGLLARAVQNNDKELIQILFKHKADPNEKNCAGDPLFADITSVDIVCLFLCHKDFNIFATDSLDHNALWKAIRNEYPAEIVDLYLKKGLDAKQLCPWDNNCLLHELAYLEGCLKNNSHLKAQLLLDKAPELINHRNKAGKTPLDFAQESLNAAKKYTCESSLAKSVEELITVFKKYAGLIAEQDEQQNLLTQVSKPTLPADIKVIITTQINKNLTLNDTIYNIKQLCALHPSLHTMVYEEHGVFVGFNQLVYFLAEKFNTSTATIAWAFETPASQWYIGLGFRLLAAIEENDLLEVTRTLEKGADIHYNSHTHSALQTAKKVNNKEIIQLLSNQPNTQDLAGDYSSAQAICEAIKKLLTHCSSDTVIQRVQTHIKEKIITQKNIYDALYTASASGKNDCVHIILAALQDQALNALFDANTNGRTALHAACCNGHRDVVQTLINAAGNHASTYVCMQTIEGYTPLMFSILNSSNDIAQLLLQAAGDQLWRLLSADNSDREHVLHLACTRNNTTCMTMLYNANKDYFKKLLLTGDLYGYLGIHKAAEYGYAEAITLLIQLYNQIKSDDPNAALEMQPKRHDNYPDLTIENDNASHSTPLHWAAQCGKLKAVQTLIEQSLNPLGLIFKEKDSKITALHVASAYGYADIVQLLLQKAGSFAHKLSCIVNSTGLTPIHVAIQNHHIDVVKVFAQEAINNNQLSALLHIKNKFDSTPLEYAKKLDRKEIVTYLTDIALIECSLCLEEKNNKEFYTMNHCSEKTGCNALFCRSCLLEHITVQLEQNSTLELMCPNIQCAQKMHNFDIQAITENKQDLYQHFLKITFDEFISQNSNTIKRCPTPNCECTYEIDINEIHRIKCPGCEQTYCSYCRVKHAPEMTCQQAYEHAQRVGNADQEKMATDQWLQQHTKACPLCKTLIEKNGGCFWMRCKKCRHEFCWKCLQPHDHTMNHPCGLWGNDEDMQQANQVLIGQLAQEEPVLNQADEEENQEEEEDDGGQMELVD